MIQILYFANFLSLPKNVYFHLLGSFSGVANSTIKSSSFGFELIFA